MDERAIETVLAELSFTWRRTSSVPWSAEVEAMPGVIFSVRLEEDGAWFVATLRLMEADEAKEYLRYLSFNDRMQGDKLCLASDGALYLVTVLPTSVVDVDSLAALFEDEATLGVEFVDRVRPRK